MNRKSFPLNVKVDNLYASYFFHRLVILEGIIAFFAPLDHGFAFASCTTSFVTSDFKPSVYWFNCVSKQWLL